MGDYLKLVQGVPADANANAASAGAADAGKLVKLDSGGKIDATMMPSGVAPEARQVQASEALAAGDLINFHDVGGAARVRKADAAAAGKPAQGFVLAAVASGAQATVYPEEAVISGLTGLTTGQRRFLSTTAGANTATAPSAAGQVAQEIGHVISPTEIMFRPETPYTLA